MTIEDVNKITGLTADGEEITPEVTEIMESNGFLPYGSEYTVTGWTPSAWLQATETERENGTGVAELSDTTNGYAYAGNEANLKTANTGSIRYKLIFGESSEKMIWLASRGVGAGAHFAGFGPGAVRGGEAYSCFVNFVSFGNKV